MSRGPMPATGSAPRVLLERAARVLALACLMALGWLAGRRSPVVRELRLGRDPLPALAALIRQPGGDVVVVLGAAPPRMVREWLVAVRAAGTGVTWRADTALQPLLLSLEPVPGPGGRHDVASLVGAGRTFVVEDRYGVLDSGTAAFAGARGWRDHVTDAVTVRADGARAVGTPSGHVDDRLVLVIGRAGWEPKFVAAALEEQGWRVETDFVVTPAQGALRGIGVRSGGGGRGGPDTATHRAVVALDESAALRAPSIAAFAGSGGGVILAPRALASPNFASIAPAAPGLRRAALPGSLTSATPRRGLDLVALRARPGAAVVEREGSLPAAVARRERLGRVLAVGFEDTWRWRLQGAEDAPEAHRRWWSGLVSSVAARRLPASPPDWRDDRAPLAALVGALGPAAVPRQAVGRSPALVPALFVLALVLLMGEWGSRRLRGAR